MLTPSTSAIDTVTAPPPQETVAQCAAGNTITQHTADFARYIQALRDHAHAWGHHEGTGRPWHRNA